MFGSKGAQLCAELVADDQLDRFNNDLFEQVVDEANEHYVQLELRMKKMHDEGLSTTTTKNADFYGGLVHHKSILRNKRCLLAYIHHRALRIRQLRWQLGAVLPQEIQELLSYPEREYLKGYSEVLGSYMLSVNCDLTVDMAPPKDPYIQVRALEDVGAVFLGDQSTSIRRNSMHLMKRCEAEPFISQGLMEEFKA